MHPFLMPAHAFPPSRRRLAAAALAALLLTVSAPAQQPAHRQSALSVHVQNPQGVALGGATVTVEMVNHAFRFGTSIEARQIDPTSASYSARAVEALETYFNSITLGNDLKWTEFESRSAARTLELVNLAYTYQAFNGPQPMRQRGHTTIWGSHWFVPNDAEAMSGEALRTRLLNHVTAYHTTLAGSGIDNFDLYNEPFHERDLIIEKLVPNGTLAAEAAEIATWYTAARAADPNARLFINEYNMLNFWQENDADIHEYKELIDLIRDAGGPVHGIGLQGHMDRFITKEQIRRRLDLLAAPMAPTANHPDGLPGLPIEITELDINTQQWTTATPEQQAEVTANVLDAAWEHPAVQGVTIWGMNDGDHWRDNAIMFDDSDPNNWVIKPSGQAWIDRVKGTWWTNTAGFTDDSGDYTTAVVKGHHRIVVEFNGQTQEFLRDVTADTALTVSFDAEPIDTSNSRLVNVSVRAPLAASQTLTLGFVVSGPARPILVRAAGPGLTALTEGRVVGVPDPRLSLKRTGSSPAVEVGANDNWSAELIPEFQAAGAFAWPAESLDAALLTSLTGQHTAEVTGNASGIILVEAYDRGTTTDGRFINVSARHQVGVDGDILIAGFRVEGTGFKRVLIRGVGPGLEPWLDDFIADPKLELHRRDPDGPVLIESNDNWSSSLAPYFRQAGAFELDAGSRDAALVVYLEAGQNYTASVSGADGGTGTAIVEVYELP